MNDSACFYVKFLKYQANRWLYSCRGRWALPQALSRVLGWDETVEASRRFLSALCAKLSWFRTSSCCLEGSFEAMNGQ